MEGASIYDTKRALRELRGLIFDLLDCDSAGCIVGDIFPQVFEIAAWPQMGGVKSRKWK